MVSDGAQEGSIHSLFPVDGNQQRRKEQEIRGKRKEDRHRHQEPERPADLVAQYLLLYELSLPFGSDINDRIDIGKSAKRMVWPGRKHRH